MNIIKTLARIISINFYLDVAFIGITCLFIRIWFCDKKEQPSPRRAFYKLSFGISALIFSLYIVSLSSPPPDHEIKPIDILAILGTILALVAWGEAAEQNAEIKEIANSLPTRYTSSFPNHLKDIIKLIETAKETIYILSDCVDSGSFSNPEDHEKVVRALEAVHDDNMKHKKNVKIKIRVCGPPQAISRCSEFWQEWQACINNTAAWHKLRDSAVFSKRLRHYCIFNNIPNTFNPQKCEREEFEEMMLGEHEKIRKHLRNVLQISVKICKHLEHMPGVFFWMKDREKAIFLLSHTGSGTQGMVFFTHDGNIIDILYKTLENVVTANLKGTRKLRAFKKYESEDTFVKLFPYEKHDLIKDYLKIFAEKLKSKYTAAPNH